MQLPDISKLTVEELWSLFGSTHDQLRKLGAIRSRNLVGDRGEQLAIATYNTTKNLPRLQMAPPSTRNIDAISTQGDRYSIKTITYPNKTTGVFHGYGSPEHPLKDKKFEYLIIVVIDSYRPVLVIELTWEDFYELKRWHSTMNAFNISLTKAVTDKAKIIYKNPSKSIETLAK